jgi:hypothetical protein
MNVIIGKAENLFPFPPQWGTLLMIDSVHK